MAVDSIQLAGGVILCELDEGFLAVGNAPVRKLPQVRPQVLLSTRTLPYFRLQAILI